MERKTDKKDNFFSLELREGEEVHIKVGEDELVFIVPYDSSLNCYLKRPTAPLFFK